MISKMGLCRSNDKVCQDELTKTKYFAFALRRERKRSNSLE